MPKIADHLWDVFVNVNVHVVGYRGRSKLTALLMESLHKYLASKLISLGQRGHGDKLKLKIAYSAEELFFSNYTILPLQQNYDSD